MQRQQPCSVLLLDIEMGSAACRYHTLMAVQSMATQLKEAAADGGSGDSGRGNTAGGDGGSRGNVDGSSAGGGAVSQAERARPLLEVLLHAPPTPPADDFPDGVSSWSGAAEVRAWSLGAILKREESLLSSAERREARAKRSRRRRRRPTSFRMASPPGPSPQRLGHVL